jgi:hypothetical protein
MSHPAALLKKYLTELNARLDRLEAKLDGGLRVTNEKVGKLEAKMDCSLQTVNETIGKLNLKFDGDMKTVNEEVSKLDAKLDGVMQVTNENVSKLGAKLDYGVLAAREEVGKLDAKFEGSTQMTNEKMCELDKEKLTAQEFREFVDVFNKILGENLPMSEEPAPQSSQPAVQPSSATISPVVQEEPVVIMDMESEAQRNSAASSAQVVDGVSPQTVAEKPSCEIEQVSPPQVVEETALPQDVAVEEPVGKHVSFPMKVVGEVFYVGDGVTSVVGDVEIPPGTTVDETLVVKGNFKSNESCVLLKNVKALKDVEIGVDNTVEGNVVSGGKVTVGSNCVVNGSIESDGDVEIGDNVIVKQDLTSKSSVKVSKLAQLLRDIHAGKGVSVT